MGHPLFLMPLLDLLVIVEDALFQVFDSDEKVAAHDDIERRQVLESAIPVSTPPLSEQLLVLLIPANAPPIEQLIKSFSLGGVPPIEEAQPIPLKPERRCKDFAAEAGPPYKGQLFWEKRQSETPNSMYDRALEVEFAQRHA